MVSLVDGKKYVVLESPAQVMVAIRRHRSEIIALSNFLQPHDLADEEPEVPAHHSQSAPLANVAPLHREVLMDPAPAIGIGLGFGVVVVANVLEGGNPMSLILLPPMLLVFGTTLLVTMAGGTMDDAKNAARSLVRAFTGNVQPRRRRWSRRSSSWPSAPAARACWPWRTRSATSMTTSSSQGVTMAIDGTDPEELREILECEVHAKRAGGQAVGQVLRRRRRLRAHHRHHRHRHGPGARAGEPRRSPRSSAT